MSTASSAAPRVLVGTVLARRWRVLHKLGDGGMGEVFAAEPLDPSGASRAALKVLRPEFVSDGHVRSRFLDEARTCMRLVHPNIARVLECAQAEDGTPFLVMELLDGVPLGAYTRDGGRVPVAQAVPILQGILAGLAAAHALGIVHRDLKPDNVMLSRDAAGTFVVKVLDFGIAKVMDVAGGMGFRTRTGMVLGTPAYMSPEQARSARDVDQRADLWSAGVLFYEMLTGRQAFPAPTEFARLAALLSVDPEPLDLSDPALTPLAAFVARALQKDRNDRFSSAHEMSRALSAAVPHLGLRPSGSPQPLARLPGDMSLSERLPPVGPPVGSGQGVAPVPTTMPAAGGALPAAASPPVAPRASGGDTLASVAGPPGRGSGGTLASVAGPSVTEAPPQVEIMMPSASPMAETLPSNATGRRSSRPRGGVAPGVVVALVVGALIAGFLLGWASSSLLGGARSGGAEKPQSAGWS